MTTIKLYTINCDGIGEWSGTDHARDCPMRVANADTAAKALSEARVAGWVAERLGGYRYDYSPQCWSRRSVRGFAAEVTQ